LYFKFGFTLFGARNGGRAALKMLVKLAKVFREPSIFGSKLYCLLNNLLEACFQACVKELPQVIFAIRKQI
jgi:hypothetical protein